MFNAKLTMLVCAAFLSACAAQGPEPTPVAAPVDLSGELTEEKIAAAQAQGYKIVNEDGQTLLCRREMPTGSRARHKTSCMTAREWQQVSDNSKQALQDMARRRPPPKGN